MANNGIIKIEPLPEEKRPLFHQDAQRFWNYFVGDFAEVMKTRSMFYNAFLSWCHYNNADPLVILGNDLVEAHERQNTADKKIGELYKKLKNGTYAFVWTPITEDGEPTLAVIEASKIPTESRLGWIGWAILVIGTIGSFITANIWLATRRKEEETKQLMVRSVDKILNHPDPAFRQQALKAYGQMADVISKTDNEGWLDKIATGVAKGATLFGGGLAIAAILWAMSSRKKNGNGKMKLPKVSRSKKSVSFPWLKVSR